MWANLAKHWFLIALAICFVVGYLGAGALRPLAELSMLRGAIVCSVMWAMGVTLRADTVRSSLTRPLPALLAIAINVVAVPLLCLPAMWLLPDRIFGGLFIAALVPCTLASASVWTRKAGGDDSIAMMTTVVTNLACLLVVPFGISMVLAEQMQVDASEQIMKLAGVVVLPLVLAQVMRRIGLATWADRNQIRLSLFGQFGILAMVVLGAVAGAATLGADGDQSPLRFSIGITLLGAAPGIHIAALYFGITVSRWLGIDRAGQIAVGISGSQKTLMVGLQIAIDCGVSVIPMLVYHVSQLVIDTVVAQRWRRNSK